MNNDIACAVCGEPWDAYGVRKDGKGDMGAWEAVLFLQGAGCPCCEGEPPSGLSQSERDALFEQFGSNLLTRGYDDFGHADALEQGLLDYEDEDRPKWDRPESEVIRECEGCGVKVLDSPDVPGDPEFYEVEVPRHYPYREEDLFDLSGWWEFQCAGYLCPHCWDTCADCGTMVFVGEAALRLASDCYDDGASFPDPLSMTKSLCVYCWEMRCTECGESSDYCSCNSSDEDDEDE